MPETKQDALTQLAATTDPAALEALRKEHGYPTSPPAPPDAAAAPEEPAIPPPPTEEDAKYAVELETMDKIFSSRRRKKEEAALKRFERDRKAWNEDRLNALGLHELAKNRHTREAEAQQADYETALAAWKKDFATFLNGRES